MIWDLYYLFRCCLCLWVVLPVQSVRPNFGSEPRLETFGEFFFLEQQKKTEITDGCPNKPLDLLPPLDFFVCLGTCAEEMFLMGETYKSSGCGVPSEAGMIQMNGTDYEELEDVCRWASFEQPLQGGWWNLCSEENLSTSLYIYYIL